MPGRQNGVTKEALSRLPGGSKPWPMQAGWFVSNTGHDQVRDRLPFVFEDLSSSRSSICSAGCGTTGALSLRAPPRTRQRRLCRCCRSRNSRRSRCCRLPIINGDPEQAYFRRRHGRVDHLFEPPFLGRSGSPAFAGSSKVYAVNPRTPPSLIFSGFPGTITPELHTAASASSPSPPLVPRFSILAVVARIGSNRSESLFIVSSSQTNHEVNATIASPSPPAGPSDGPHPPSNALAETTLVLEKGRAARRYRQRPSQIWLPFLDTYRTMCLAPQPEFRRLLDQARDLPIAA